MHGYTPNKDDYLKQSVSLGLLEDHLGHCVTEAVAEGGEVAELKVREASDPIARLVRS